MIIAFTTYIAGFITEFIIADLDDNFEVFWYMLGAGVMSINTGVKFYKHGKPKIGPGVEEIRWEEELEELGNALADHFEGKLKGLAIDLLSVFVKNILDSICDLLGIPTNGNLDILYSEFVKQIKKAVVDQDFKKNYKNVFKPLDYISYGAGWIPSYSRDLKLFSLITIMIGALQMIIGFVALCNE